MINHIHLIAVPENSESFAQLFKRLHRKYSLIINQRNKWSGHLWQFRYSSFPLDQSYLLNAARYIERNPVAAGIVSRPQDYEWSSARAHCFNTNDTLLQTDKPLLKKINNWKEFISQPSGKELSMKIEYHARTGRPMGDEMFVRYLEHLTGRIIRPGKPGRKPVSK